MSWFFFSTWFFFSFWFVGHSQRKTFIGKLIWSSSFYICKSVAHFNRKFDSLWFSKTSLFTLLLFFCVCLVISLVHKEFVSIAAEYSKRAQTEDKQQSTISRENVGVRFDSWAIGHECQTVYNISSTTQAISSLPNIVGV